MNPVQFRRARKLYRQSQAEWAITLGFEGKYAFCTMHRYEAGRSKIPGTVAKLVELLVDKHVRDLRESIIPSDLVDFRPGQVLHIPDRREA